LIQLLPSQRALTTTSGSPGGRDADVHAIRGGDGGGGAERGCRLQDAGEQQPENCDELAVRLGFHGVFSA